MWHSLVTPGSPVQAITKPTCDIMVLLINRIKLCRAPQAAVDVPSWLAQHVHGHAGGKTETELLKKSLCGFRFQSQLSIPFLTFIQQTAASRFLLHSTLPHCSSHTCCDKLLLMQSVFLECCRVVKAFNWVTVEGFYCEAATWKSLVTEVINRLLDTSGAAAVCQESFLVNASALNVASKKW